MPDHDLHTAERRSRRQFVRSLGGGLGAIGLAGMLDQSSSAKEVSAHTIPRAKRVIQLFMNGGPHGPDLFDPKPNVAKFEGQRPAELSTFRTERKTEGLMASPFQFRLHGESGIAVSELLPHFATCIDDVCVPSLQRDIFTTNLGAKLPRLLDSAQTIAVCLCRRTL